MNTLPLTIIFPDGKRLHVREPPGVPREGDHALVIGNYYRVDAVVWRFGMTVHDGDLSVPAMPVEVHLQPASAPVNIDCNRDAAGPGHKGSEQGNVEPRHASSDGCTPRR